MTELGEDDMPTEELTPKEVSRELRRLTAEVNKITKHLFGNGEKGQDELIRNMSTAMEQIKNDFSDYKKNQITEEKERAKAREENKTWLKRTIIVAAIPYAISFIVWLVYWRTSLQPLLESVEKVVP
jgi:hypothetical protein